jgi:hypothetical protein
MRMGADRTRCLEAKSEKRVTAAGAHHSCPPGSTGTSRRLGELAALAAFMLEPSAPVRFDSWVEAAVQAPGGTRPTPGVARNGW